ncbi:MAG: COQ9 family protein [Geminicoccaceae bacterium]|nr:COQ9 family protein [Geminicoccaceae bacterium]
MSDAIDERRELKDRIIEAALVNAAFDGWTRGGLVAAGRELEIDAPTVRRLFAGRGDAALDWLDDWLDRRMLSSVPAESLEAMPVRKRISSLVRARFEVVNGHEEAMRRAVLARGLGGNMIATARSTWRTADRIWAAAGFADKSTDGFSRYTRRSLLVGILVSTFLFWLEDKSIDHVDSWSFLDRRIDDALRIGKASASLKRFVPFAGRLPVPARRGA